MNIGIDIGGSHIAAGLVDEYKIIIKKEHNWTKEEKLNFSESIETKQLETLQAEPASVIEDP